ncbi:MAG: hypothetical protein D8M57_16410 [Candidatus Scalindua sp. AMX11]|nr:MAG: hypothetical protein DWQ00_02545 [Candidatus Scalindua sp.]TDE63781.1 MAG: hypothetical protein D8M57_16410 [Candidatus Scalindua sp. AMX11]GJQ58371.1 MAG: hypothetical protein SCALA701_11720 [Candidatus Scalindua sp.]
MFVFTLILMVHFTFAYEIANANNGRGPNDAELESRESNLESVEEFFTEEQLDNEYVATLDTEGFDDAALEFQSFDTEGFPIEEVNEIYKEEQFALEEGKGQVGPNDSDLENE